MRSVKDAHLIVILFESSYGVLESQMPSCLPHLNKQAGPPLAGICITPEERARTRTRNEEAEEGLSIAEPASWRLSALRETTSLLPVRAVAGGCFWPASLMQDTAGKFRSDPCIYIYAYVSAMLTPQTPAS